MSVVATVARAAGDDVRPPGSAPERAAAERLAAWLRARGDAAEVRERPARPQAPAALGIGAAIGAAGSLLSVASVTAGLACAAAGLLVVALEAAGVPSPVRLAFPRRRVADVVVAAAGGGAAVLVVCAPFASGRLGPAFGPRRRGLPWVAGAAAVVTAACAARALGADGVWLGVLQLVPTIVLLGTSAAALDAGLAGWGPGESAAAAVAVAVHDELAAQPPRHLAPALLLYGGRGRPRLDAAVVLELRPRTAGLGADPRLAPAVTRAAAALGVAPPAGRAPRGTIVLGADGDPEALVDLGLAVADALDQAQTSSPPTTVTQP